MQPLEHDDIGRNQQKAAGVGAGGVPRIARRIVARRISGRFRGRCAVRFPVRFVDGVEVAPDHRQRHHHRLAAAGGHLHAVAGETAVLQQPHLRVADERLQQRPIVPQPPHFIDINQRLHRRPLRRVEPERLIAHRMVAAEPKTQQPARGFGGAGVLILSPLPHRRRHRRGAGWPRVGRQRLIDERRLRAGTPGRSLLRPGLPGRRPGLPGTGHSCTSSRRVASLPRMSMALTTMM